MTGNILSPGEGNPEELLNINNNIPHPMFSMWLHNVPGMTNLKIEKILKQAGTSEELYGWSKERMMNDTSLTIEEINAITESKARWDPKAEWIKLMEMGISFVSMEQKEYPNRLRNIHNPPFGLYYKGCLPNKRAQPQSAAMALGWGERKEKPQDRDTAIAEDDIPYLKSHDAGAKRDKKTKQNYAVAIVGARSRSEYGLQVARQLAEVLAQNDISVISGLARGIDADAHIGALDGGGQTYAVLGCGVDICYPRSNQHLYNRILDSGGGIISEYPPGQKPLAILFPQRNRIISGLSDCVVIVEARKKSGSLITADFAMEQGRDVFAVPGRVSDALSEGTNKLIHEGAGIYIGPEEFLSDINLSGNFTQQLSFCKKILENDERLIYSVLDFSPMGLGTLMQKTSVPLERLLQILASLIEKGYIRESVPNYYVRKL